ncbi:MAG: TetR/AcrR family transcriptional regulator [Phenylobacterium sp.]|uniref:TetR/AcrR family transcriptional regulator n=1 Tax=Phenylobacterium sp. TaxID=1871053 RepID=UPI002735BC0C|nr:TetR/AcrR family transcriptional regulator [Phenylobacterium sp.]MDP3748793.1 TetR/AcrR family transcriptional regulator [Phenylobacterium sp.]
MPRILTDEEIASFRARLCHAAEGLLAEGGREALSMRAVAARLGVSPMTPYRYFESKQALVTALQVRAFERLAKALETADSASARGASNAVGEAYVVFASEQASAYRLMFELPASDQLSDPALASAVDRARASMLRNAERAVGGFRTPSDAQLAGVLFWAMLHGMLALEITSKPLQAIDSERLRAAAGRALATICRGLAHSQPKSC